MVVRPHGEDTTIASLVAVSAEYLLVGLEVAAERNGIAEMRVREPSVQWPNGEWLRLVHLPSRRLADGYAYIIAMDPLGTLTWPEVRSGEVVDRAAALAALEEYKRRAVA